MQALIGIGSGGITGEGLGESIQKINFLPEAHTDMIFAVIGEELGLVGAILVAGAFLVFAWAGLRIAAGCADPFGKRLAVGHHDPRLRASSRQPRRRAGHRAAHGYPAAVRLLRGVVSRRSARCGRDPP